jgi:hypothetical protein
MLKIALLAMLRLSNLGNPGRKRWCTAIVLVAICSLTISVATRYGAPSAHSNDTVTVVQSSLEPGLQRLLNNAATWVPPAVDVALLQDPVYHPHVAPSGPTISSVLLERNLYKRPPPFLLSFTS